GTVRGHSVALAARESNMRNILTIFAVLFAPYIVHAQGTFLNLGFESADLPPVPSGQFGDFVPITQALPGWMGLLGTSPATRVSQNNFALGSPNIAIFGPNWTTAPWIIEDDYTVLLQAGVGGGEVTSLLQSGSIAVGSKSLQFRAAGTGFPGPPDFSVFFTGQELEVLPLSSGPNYTLYGADISAFSGQTGDLRFTALANNLLLDSIGFSPVPVPEPGVLPLAGIGAALLAFGLWRRQKSSHASRGPWLARK